VLLKNGCELTIRKAVKEDAKNLLDYLNIVGGESDNLLFGAGGFGITVEQEERFIESMQTSQTSALFVGLINDKIVSVGNISAHARERISHNCDIAVSVRKAFWGAGIGTCLMNELIDFAKQTNKLEIVHLGVRSDNTRAIALYERLGFQKIGSYPGFFKIDGKFYDEVLMNLYL